LEEARALFKLSHTLEVNKRAEIAKLELAGNELAAAIAEPGNTVRQQNAVEQWNEKVQKRRD
jgi:hypothetical protein